MAETRKREASRQRLFRALVSGPANEDGSIPISFSSEEPVERWWGIEILSHAPGAMDMTRAKDGLPFLADHGRTLLGRMKNIRVENGKGRGDVYFSSAPEAQQYRQDMLDGIRPDVSVAYDVQEETCTRGEGNAPDTWTATSWMPYESSSVMVAADPTVGVGRSKPAPGSEPDPTPQPAADPAPAAEAATTRNLPADPAGTTRKEGPTMTPEEIVAAQRAAVQDATRQALQLQAIADTHGKGKEARELLAAKPLEEARGEIMEMLATAPISQPRSLEDMGASDKEIKEFSYCRLLDAAVAAREGRSQNCMELEISQSLSREMPKGYEPHAGGVFAPYQLRKGDPARSRAAMDSVTAGAGKELVFTEPMELIEILRNKLIIARMGAQFLTGLRAPMGFAKQTGKAVAQWIQENPGADATTTESATGLVTLTGQTLIGGSAFSRQLLTLGNWSAEQMVRNDLAFSHAAAIDLAAIHGTGTNQPTGLYNLAGVNSVAFGGAPTYGKLVDMITALAAANALLGSVGYATNPLVAGKLMQTLEFAVNGASKIWQGSIDEGLIAGQRAVSSNQIATNLGAGHNEIGCVAGSWNQCIVGQFGPGFELITDPFKYKLQGLIEVSSFEMAGVIFRHPEAFTLATGLTLG